ncbi:hypothetical protein SDC9_188414 [bioreactor metagenome]|uniref:Uncharacterized protein n=1 Tax=bioreactor metagenome TaxID=1076179 RepID=A0A645HXH7_9ZZZZ
MQRDRQPQAEDQAPDPIRSRHLGQFLQLAAMPEHQQRQSRLVFLGKTRHVGISQDIGTVLVIGVVRHGDADLVQAAGPGQVLDVSLPGRAAG